MYRFGIQLLFSALILCPSFVSAGLVTGPSFLDGTPQSAVPGSAPVLTDVAPNNVYLFTATSTTHFMQIEVNEDNDNSVDVQLDFFEDINTDGLYGGDASAEDMGLDFAVALDPIDFTGTLAGNSPQDVFEWTLSNLTIGNDYGVLVEAITNFNNGPERIQFTAGTVAVPEPSAFMLVTVAGLAVAGWHTGRRRRRR